MLFPRMTGTHDFWPFGGLSRNYPIIITSRSLVVRNCDAWAAWVMVMSNTQEAILAIVTCVQS